MESRRPGATVGVCRVVKELGVVRQVFGVLLPGFLGGGVGLALCR